MSQQGSKQPNGRPEAPPPVLIPVAPVHGSHAWGTTPREIWNRLSAILDARKPSWREYVNAVSVDHLRRKRDQGATFSDEEVVEALFLSLLSSNVDWNRIQQARGDLRHACFNYDAEQFAEATDQQIADLYARLHGLGVASQNLRRMLRYFCGSIQRLVREIGPTESLDSYFANLYKWLGKSPEKLAMALGLPGQHKLRGFGVALAAEGLRNLGYNLAKPDRHILRAFGMWRLVEFPRWTDRAGNHAPPANSRELFETMCAVRNFADKIGESVSLTDTTIWYACARTPGGGQLSNADLAGLRDQAGNGWPEI